MEVLKGGVDGFSYFNWFSFILFSNQTHPWYLGLLTIWTFSLWCALLIKSWSLNWPWSIKILGQFVTRACKFISQSDVKHIMTSPIKTITSVLKAWTDIITDIPTHPKLAEILPIMSVETFKITDILYLSSTCSIWAGKLHWLDTFLLYTKKCTVNDQNITFFWYPCHMLPVELWKPNCKSSSLPVDRKYQKEQSRDNYKILLFNSKYKRQWINMIFSAG